MNMSTAKIVTKIKSFAQVTSMQFDPLGQFLFAGDDKVLIILVHFVITLH